MTRSRHVTRVTALVAADFLRVARIKPGEHLANYARWYKTVSSRPSAAA